MELAYITAMLMTAAFIFIVCRPVFITVATIIMTATVTVYVTTRAILKFAFRVITSIYHWIYMAISTRFSL